MNRIKAKGFRVTTSMVLAALLVLAGVTLARADSPFLTLGGPTHGMLSSPLNFGGSLQLVGVGISGQTVELMVGDQALASASTDASGHYQAAITFATTGTQTVQAVV